MLSLPFSYLIDRFRQIFAYYLIQIFPVYLHFDFFGDTCPHWQTIGLLIPEVKEFVKSIAGKCLFRPNNKFLIDMAFSLADSVNLAHGKFHDVCQLGQAAVVSVTQLEDSGSDYHGRVFLL